MQLRHAVVGLALAALLLPASAVAQIESTPIPTVVKPNFSSMDFLIGTWTCSTKSSRRPAPYVTVSTYSMDSSGYWMNETSTTKPTAWVPNALTINDKITYDPDTKRWVDVQSGDQGAYGLLFSTGWNGNRIVWHDAGFAPTSQISSQTSTTTTKTSATKTVSTSSFTEGKTGRRVSVVATCNKG